MGASDSKLKFKNHVFRLADQYNTEPFTTDYWNVFWKQPESVNEIFNVFSCSDIRYIRDSNIKNFCMLLRSISNRLIELTTMKISLDKYPTNELLNCLRLLSKLLPFFYEKQELQSVERTVFWSLSNSLDPQTANSDDSTSVKIGVDSPPSSSNELSSTDSTKVNVGYVSSTDKIMDNASMTVNFENEQNSQSTGIHLPLGARLILIAVNLLFTAGFTVSFPPSTPSASKQQLSNTVEFSIWEPGVGLSGKPQQPETYYDCHKLEVLRFIMTLCSQCLYRQVGSVVPCGSRYLTVLVSSTPKLQMLSLISSLINITSRSTSEEDNGLDGFNNNAFKETRILMVTNAIQLLTTMIVYPLPKLDLEFLKKQNILNEIPTNLVRYYCGKLHKDHELLLLESGILKPIFKPMEAAKVTLLNATSSGGLTNLMKGKSFNNADPSIWSTELIVLFWEMFQCNKRFRMYVTNKLGVNIMVVLAYYVSNFKNVEKYRNLVRLCSYLFLFLSCDPTIASNLMKPFDKSFYDTLPSSFRITTAISTYRDFLVIQACKCIMFECPKILIPTLIEWIYNLVPLIPAPENDESNPPMFNRRMASKDLNQNNLNLSYGAISQLTQVIYRYSTIHMLKDNNINLDLLALLMRAVCLNICGSPENASTTLFVLTRNIDTYEGVMKQIKTLSQTMDDEDNNNSNNNPNTINNNNSNTITTTDLDQDAPFSPMQPPPPARHLSQTSVLSTNSSPTIKSAYSVDDGIEPVALDPITEGQVVEETLIRPRLPVGMSTKAKSKQPMYAPLEVTWTGSQATKIICEFIQFVKANIDINPTINASATIMEISMLDIAIFAKSLRIPSEYNPNKTKFEQLKFTWSNLSLGWYECVVWASIYHNNDITKTKNLFTEMSTTSINAFKSWGLWKTSPTLPTDTNSSEHIIPEPELIDKVSKCLSASGMWSGTNVRLFTLKEKARDQPSFLYPKGGTDSLNDSFIKRLGSISFSKRKSSASLQSLLTSPSTPQINTALQAQQDVPTGARLSMSNPSSPTLQQQQQHHPSLPLFQNQNPFSSAASSTASTRQGSPSLSYSPIPSSPSPAHEFDQLDNSNQPQFDFTNVQLRLTPRNSLNLNSAPNRSLSTPSGRSTPQLQTTPTLGPQP